MSRIVKSKNSATIKRGRGRPKKKVTEKVTQKGKKPKAAAKGNKDDVKTFNIDNGMFFANDINKLPNNVILFVKNGVLIDLRDFENKELKVKRNGKRKGKRSAK